jgi:CDP-6-deoxy-D-xylo-4-hexulose-3-dehydrase
MITEAAEKAEQIKKEIHHLVKEYYELTHGRHSWKEGQDFVPVSGKVFDHSEIQYIVDSALDAWFTTGRFNSRFERELARFIGVKFALTVNSGSSANLVAISGLCAPELGERAIQPGDEIITVAASFPTTINPLLTYGAVPVFLDVDPDTHNIDVSYLEQALSPKTKAVVIAHSLGNPFDLGAVKAFCDKHNLWLMEDCCDALGATYDGRHVGTFGHVGTLSFYPAHHITMGEGGAVFTNDVKLKTIKESYRDWGPDCYCQPGKDNTCKKRFEWQLGELPYGYDHKYIYSRLGFNLKITDMQAALGLAQLPKLPGFIDARRRNFTRLSVGLQDLQHKIQLPVPTSNSEPSWFGYLITLKKDAGISRKELLEKLNEHKIGTRLLFAGDLRKQPYFKGYQYRSIGDLPHTEAILNQSFWIGVTPLITDDMVDYMVKIFHSVLAD